MKKVLIFHPALAPYRKDFFNALGQKLNLKVVFLLRNNLNQGFNQDLLLQDSTYAIEYLDHTFTILRHRVNLGYIKAITNFQPEIVITSEFGFSTIIVYLYKMLLNKRFELFTISDDSEEIIINVSGIRRYLRKFFAKRLSGIICINPKVADTYKSWGNKRPIVFPIIRSEELFNKEQDSIREISKKHIEIHNLANKINILFVGRLAKEKNLQSLLLTFSQLPEDLKGKCNIIIVGEGKEKSNLLNQAQQLNISNNLILPGKYENKELMAWYNIGSFFILPSLYEPFGAVTAEALMSGTPVMISNRAGSSWLVNSHNGVVFDPQSEQEYINELTQMINKSHPTPTDGFVRDSLLPCNFDSHMSSLLENLEFQSIE